MKRRAKAICKWALIVPLIVSYLVLWALPASWWFESRSLQVSDAVVGELPIVIEDRHIHWSFIGKYTASVRSAVDPQVIMPGCHGSGEIPYKGGLDGRKSYDLSDFIDNAPGCARLPEGAYYVEVCRTVLYPLWGILPSKTTCVTSNVFNVRSE